MSGQRKALIIANDEYDQEALRDLLAPAADAETLGRVLGDAQIGNFAVQVVRNEPSYVIEEQIEGLFSESRPDDVLLLHFSGHGLKSESGELFFAASNTRPNRLGSTAVSADFVQRCMRDARSRSIVLLLDCCYGGAFARGVTVRAAGDVNVMDSFPQRRSGGGRGRAVITASSAMEYAFEGNQLADDHRQRPSVFTSALVEGLATGDADRDEDGWISLDELYDYVFDKVREQNPHQTPSCQVDLQGELYLAGSLQTRLTSEDLPAAAGAYQALAELARTDIHYLADLAAAALDQAAVRPEEMELHFGEQRQGSDPPHRMIRLLGPPIARACTPRVSRDWIRVHKTTEGFDVSVDTTNVGTLRGSLDLKGPTGEVTIAIEVEVLSAPSRAAISKPASEDIPPSTPAPSSVPEAPSPPISKVHVEPPAPSSGPMVSSPTHARRHARGTTVLGVFLALLPTLTIGILTPILAPIPFAHAAVRLHERRLWVITCAYGLGSLTLWILWIVAIDRKWQAASLIFYLILFALGIVATIHAFKLRPRIFAVPSLPTAAGFDPPHTVS